jgi:hypothetical protein
MGEKTGCLPSITQPVPRPRALRCATQLIIRASSPGLFPAPRHFWRVRGSPVDREPRARRVGRCGGSGGFSYVVVVGDVPGRGGRGPRGDGAHRDGRHDARAVPAPDALPRLLRAGSANKF